MTEQDKQEVGAILAAVLAKHSGCPNGITAETAETLKNFADAINTGRKAALKAFITLLIGAILAAIIEGANAIFNK